MRAAANNFLGRLPLWQKLALVAVAMAVPAALLGYFYLDHTAQSVQQARSELEGVRYLQALNAVAAQMLTHRNREYTFLSGDKPRRSDVLTQEGEVDKQIMAADTINAELGDRLGVSQAWRTLRADWTALESKGLEQSVEENDAAHAALQGQIDRLIEVIAARSLTAVDPDVSTQALFQISYSYVPSLMQYASSIRRHAVRAASKSYLGGDDRMGIRVFHDRQDAELQRLQTALQQIEPTVRTPVTDAVSVAKSATDSFQSYLQAKILSAANMDTPLGTIYDAGAEANHALQNVSVVGYATLAKTVELRLTRANQLRILVGSCAILALALAVGLAVLIIRSLASPLHHAVKVFGRISSGHYENQIAVPGTDEASQVLLALERMQGTLRTQIETERAVAAENSRIRHALDKASTSVLLADSQHRIIYVNDTARATLAGAQHEIRKSLPSFDPQSLQGSNLDALATNPGGEHQRLEGLRGSETQERALGGMTFRTVSSPVLGEHGERLGTVMEWTDRTQEVAIEKEMEAMLAAVNAGDLASRILLTDKSAFFEAASRGINQLADNLAAIVAQVKEAASEVYRSSKEIASGNNNLQQRTEEQSASLEQTASSMEQMTTTVRQNADNAGEANQLAVAARAQAESGGNVVNKAIVAMSEINESSRKIADIIGVIDEIAFQTNLLALNAAVEAARAGEQGRGFAVVATEVRTLAGRSATAAKEIKELIQDSVKKVEDGSVYVTRSGQTLEQIVASVKKVSDIVAEIAAASHEQSAGIGQVNRAVLQMDELTQQNAALVGQATTASQGMASEAHALYELMGSYRLGDLAQPTQSRPTAVAASTAGEELTTGARAESTNDEPAAPQVKRASAPRAARRPAGGAAAAAVAVVDDSEWQEF
jgi:methyl-accepting chemotaxis protein